MSKKKGFTLIEILVVIAIMAILLSLLTPVLSRIEEQTKAVTCMANLRQWALSFSMYAEEHSGQLMPNLQNGRNAPDWNTQRRGMWYNATFAYYREPKLLLCPSATGTYADGARAPYAAAMVPIDVTPLTIPGGVGIANAVFREYPASYGINSWMSNPPQGVGSGRNDSWLWRNCNVKSAADIPVLLDIDRHDNTTPLIWDEPPEYEGEPLTGNSNEMRSCCINRHSGCINTMFLDFSVRRVGLKQLWLLKWHRQWDTGLANPVWPQWMKYLRDYD